MTFWPLKYEVIVGLSLVGFFVIPILNLLVKLQELLSVNTLLR